MTNMNRPMLADNKPWDEKRIQAHLNEVGCLLMQPKIDGMRSMNDMEAKARTRSWKLHANTHLQRWAGDHPRWRGLDGEVIPGLVYNPDVFREAMSGIRSVEGSPEMTIYAFDFMRPGIHELDYIDRRNHIQNLMRGNTHMDYEQNGYHVRIVLCPQKPVRTLSEIYAHEEELLLDGWEGAILRRNDRSYKFGRSTAREGALLKLKRWVDAEAVVVGYEAAEENQNEAVTDARGYTTRSAHQDNKVALERLGALHVELFTDRSVKFKIGVFQGWSHTDLENLWQVRDTLKDRIIKFKHQGYGGGYDVPRTPVGLGWRSAADM